MDHPSMVTIIASQSIITLGFMERPDMPALMAQIAMHGGPIHPNELTYFVGMEKIVAREGGHGIPRWIHALFALLLRNGARVTDYLRIPHQPGRRYRPANFDLSRFSSQS